MELRQPPSPPNRTGPDGLVRLLLVLNLLLLTALAVGFFLTGRAGAGTGASPERDREVASKLKAAGALEEAAALYEQFLAAGTAQDESRAKIAYSLGTTFLDRGQYEKALRWFYEAEALGAGNLSEDVGKKIVHSLERLGRFHAAQAALDSRVRLTADPAARSEADPVVAQVAGEAFHRSDVQRALDDLPPELARAFSQPEQRAEFLKKFVADELLWRKARKLEYDDDPEVRRRQEALFRQLVVSRLVEREVLEKIEVDEADLRNHFEAHKARFQAPPAEGEEAPETTFEQARRAVEQDYRRLKTQSAYSKMIDDELATAEVELFPERLQDGG